MKRTGEILKKEREARGLSLQEIGLSLKINSKILKAIEEGDATRLPAKTFLRGFVQSYAGYLRLNVEDVLKVFADEMGTTRPQSPVKELSQEPAHEPKSTPSAVAVPPSAVFVQQKESSKKEKKTSLEDSSTTKGLIFSLLGVILAGLILVTMKVIDRYQREAQVATVDVTPIQEEQVPLDNKSIEESTEPVATVTTPTAEVSPPPPIVTPPVVATNLETNLAKPAPVTTATPKEIPTPAPVIAKTPLPPKPVEAPKEPLKETIKEPVKEVAKLPDEKKAKAIELIVEALDSVEIEYASGSGKMEKIKLEPEQIHTFKSKVGLRLTINNGGAVNMILNGKDLGVPGDLGKSIKLNY